MRTQRRFKKMRSYQLPIFHKIRHSIIMMQLRKILKVNQSMRAPLRAWMMKPLPQKICLKFPDLLWIKKFQWLILNHKTSNSKHSILLSNFWDHNNCIIHTYIKEGPQNTKNHLLSSALVSTIIPMKGHWTKEEDQMLADAVKRNSGKNWKKIAESLPGRTDV